MKNENLLKIGFLLLYVSILLLPSIVSASDTRATETVEVTHPIQGSFPKILIDVSYDVDYSQSFSLDDTRYRIENAQSLADANNGEIDWYEKFHFWPNIFDLTEIYYHDTGLYNRIVYEILENEPDKDAIAAQLNTEVSRGDRVFLARDFVPVVEDNDKTYYEVHYAFIINLDKRYIQELQVHDYSALGVLHDPHTDKLTAVFSKTDVPIGQVWELCLRGNLKRTKYNSIIVDKLDESPNPEFFIERVHLSCVSFYYAKEELPTAPPFIPLNKTPPNPEPEEKIPIPPGNPNHPPPPGVTPEPSGGVITPSPPVRPWPFGYPEQDTTPIPPTTPGSGESEPDSGEACPEDEEAIQQKQHMLEELNRTLEEMRARFNEDVRTLNDNFTCYPGQWDDNARFNDPCIQEIYGRYNEQIQELKEQIENLREESGDISDEIKSLKDQFGPVIQTYIYRESLWDNMLHVGGEWSHVSVPCGGGVLMPGHSSGSPAKIDVTPEQQGKFQQDVAYALMQGKTWEEAVNEAIANNIPGDSEWDEYIWKEVWNIYANCLKKLHTKQLEIYLKKVFPEASDEQIAQMINVMFNGQSGLTHEQQSQLDQNNKQIDELKKKQGEKINQINELRNQINDLRRQFRQEVRDKCLNRLREEIEKKRQAVWILESFLDYCKNPDRKYEFKYRDWETFCKTLREMLNDHTYTNNQGLKGFLELLLRNHCRNVTPSISEQIDQGVITPQFISTGSASGHIADLTITSNTDEPLTISIKPGGLEGMILVNPNEDEQDLVITRIPGISTGPTTYKPADNVTLDPNESVTLPVEGYCANMFKKNPSEGVELTLNGPIDEDVQDVIDILEDTEFPENFTPEDVNSIKQITIWISQPANKDETPDDYERRGYPIKDEYKPVITEILNQSGINPDDIVALTGKKKEKPPKEPEIPLEEFPWIYIGAAAAGILAILGIYKIIVKK